MTTWYTQYLPHWANRWWTPPIPSHPYQLIRPAAMNDPMEQILTVVTVDLCQEKNHDDHHTDHFYAARDALIVRRGEPFRLRLQLNRAFEPNKDAISFIFTVADDKNPSPGHGTLIAIAPRYGSDYLGDLYDWGAAIDTYDEHKMTILIKPAVTCPVTVWKMEVDTKLLGSGSKSLSVPLPLYTLFNPWCKDDQVYMEDYEQRKEYVMHDTTLIWRGSYNRMRPSVWKLGQFERHVLECSIELLGTFGRIPAAYRGDPVRVARALSAAVNSVDDNGMILGNWTENFSGGTAPTKWTGSTEIIQQFYKTQRPIKFGQCWNFSGVLTTIARALGLPSRIVTCYSSAHDTQASLTVDIFIDHNNKKMETETTDSIWNYHVWNEVWMERPDLGVGPNGVYNGWQVVDATPQESSDSMYRCGPAPVTAVKHGEILRPFDCGFVFSEVNADKVYWRYNGPYQPIKMLRKDTLAIGHLISTKAVLKWERTDITSNYKFDEKTDEERNIMLKALKQSKHAFSRYYLNDNFSEVEFEMSLNDDIVIGETFNVLVKVTNKAIDREHTVSIQLSCDAILYTGISGHEVKSEAFNVKLSPATNTEALVSMDVTFEDYFSKLTSQASFNISCAATVEGTDYEYYAQDDFRVRKPDIKFTFHDKIVSQQVIDVTIRLTNPLPIPLKKGIFHIEGPGIQKPLKFKIAEIPVGGTAASTFTYVPPYAGRGTLLAKFTSKELNDVDGYIHYEIEPRPEDVLTNGHNRRTDVIRRRSDIIP